MLLDEFDPKHPLNATAFGVGDILKAKYQARRYLFANETLTAVAHLLRDHPNVFLDNFQFALPPHEKTYLEFNIRHFHTALGRPTSSFIYGFDHGEDYMADHTLGFLILGNRVRVLVKGGERNSPALAVLTAYTINDHTPIPDATCVSQRMKTTPKELSSIERQLWGQEGIDMQLAHILGSTMTNPRATLTIEQSSELTRRFQFWIHRDVAAREKVYVRTVFGGMGEIRTMLALLLWLNQPSLVEVTNVPASRRWYGHKQLPYAAHNIVKLKPNLTRKKIIRSFGHARSPRRHEVRAFWRNFEKTPGCIHDWPLFPDEHGHYHCGRCPQWRTRVREHERGDATVGFVTKHYEV